MKPSRHISRLRQWRPNKARGTWLSLFAMLMIFVGPLVSQAMPTEHGRSASMAMSMPEHGCQQSQPADPERAGLHPLWEKCGYCSLFFHCPALPQALSFAASDACEPQHPLRIEPRQGHARSAVFPGARTRAPPFSHLLQA